MGMITVYLKGSAKENMRKPTQCQCSPGEELCKAGV